MSYDVQDLKNDITGMIHGTTSNQITNFDGVINRSARQLLLDIDPQETKRQVEFVNPIFDTVYDYPLAADVKGNKIIDIYPQVNRLPRDIWTQAYNQAFDVAKQNIYSLQDMFTINFNSSVKTIKVNAPFLNAPVIIDNIEAIATNGTWMLSNNATNLTVNNSNFVQGSGSLQFDTTTGLAELINQTLYPVDLSSYVNQASLFVWVFVPTGSALTNVTLIWGSNLGADNYAVTVTQNQQGTAFVNGWNLCKFDWASATITGTPDPSQITYAEIDLTTSANMTAVKVNGLNNILGTILNYSYYSKFLFRDAITGAYQETVTDDSNLINLDTESFNLLTYQVLYQATQQQQGLDASFFDSGFAKNAYDAGVLRYKSMYKSELQKPQSLFYPMPRRGYGRFLPRNWN